VLFADLKGSMEMLAERDPEDARKLLDPVLERMMEAVHRFEGTVNQVMGDGIMALFGAPLALEDHAVRAGYAALRIRETMTVLAEEHEERRGERIKFRIGLNSGEVVVRTIGSDLRMDYSAVGQTTHLAARMEQLAPPGSILVTEAFTRLTDSYLQFKPLGLVSVKGLGGPVDVFELTGPEPTGTRIRSAEVSRGLTHLVGRQDELNSLLDALDRAEAGSGQIVGVVGEPGLGKSRLCHELVRSARARSWLALETSSVSYGQMTAWMPLSELLRAYFQIETRASASEIRHQVATRLTALDSSLMDFYSAILWLLDVPVEDPRSATVDPEQRRQAALDGVRRMLALQSRLRPLLLVFENLHWIDTETQTFLNRLVDGLRDTRILLLVNYRPEYRHAWANKIYYAQIRLDPLTPPNAEELLRALLGDAPELAPLKALLIERAQGNPFFLEESAHTLIETRVVTGERSAFRVAKPISNIRVPVTVQAVLAARIDRLSADDKWLLQCAAVIGRQFSRPLLEAIMGDRHEDLDGGLVRLQSLEFLYETKLFPEIEFTFKHVLTQEVAYDSLLQDRRRTLHARILSAIESLGGKQLTHEVERLVHHAFRGEVWDKAARYARQAGDKAAGYSANREAVGFYEQALAALEHLPEDRPAMEQGIDIRLDLRRTLVPLADSARILDHMRKAEALAQRIGDHRRLSWVVYGMAHYHYLAHEQERSVEASKRALALGGRTDLAHEVAVNLLLGHSLHYTGDYREATVVLRRNVEVLVGGRARERFGLPIFPTFPAVTSRERLARCLAELGDFEEAIRLGAEGMRIAEDIDHPPSLTGMCLGLGTVHMQRNDVTTAIPVLERGLTVGRRGNIFLYVYSVAAALGRALAVSGRLAEGLALMSQVVTEGKHHLLGYSHRLIWLAEGHLAADDYANALGRAQEALEFTRRYKEKGQEVWSLHVLGEIARRRDAGAVEEAERFYREAITVADTLGMVPALARCHLGLGELYAQTGRGEVAQECLRVAAALFQDIGIASLRERSERLCVALSG
jgi:class 3 adenylate cyclase/tetratricopeptide (TPR) repeat protein